MLDQKQHPSRYNSSSVFQLGQDVFRKGIRPVENIGVVALKFCSNDLIGQKKLVNFDELSAVT